MSLTLDRDMVAQALIVLALCIGGWMMIVGPKADEVAELRATIAEAKTNPILNQEAIEMMAGRLQEIRDRVDEIRDQNRFARDSSRIYGLITSLAASHGLKLQNLDPGSDRAAKGDEQVAVITFQMSVEGEYEQVASFVAAIEGIEGFVRPVALDLSPREAGGRRCAEARIVCEAVSFTLPAELAAIVGALDADR